MLTDSQPRCDVEFYPINTTTLTPRFAGPIGLDGKYRTFTFDGDKLNLQVTLLNGSRFKAILQEPSEALVINRYIHLNPVRVKVLGGHETRDVGDTQIDVELARQRVDALEQYPWSSYAFFAGTRSAPAWICTEAILGFFWGRLRTEAPTSLPPAIAGGCSCRTLGDRLEGAN